MLSPVLAKQLSGLLGINTKRGDVGIELEIEGDNLPMEVTSWIVKHEGSLRGKGGRVVTDGDMATDTPREYVSRQPVNIGAVLEKVTNLQEAFTKNKSVVRLTPRASTHIHLNMTNETVSTFLAFLIVYSAIEPVLLRACGPLRNGNLFCLPTYETWDLPAFTQGICKALLMAEPRYRWLTRGKYGALNPDPLLSLGSVEVRCFPNSVDPHEIFDRARWLVNIRSFASAMQPPYDEALFNLNRNPTLLLRSIFGNSPVQAACHPHTPENLILFGLEQSHEIREGMEPVLNWSEKEKKEEQSFYGLADDMRLAGGAFAPEPVDRWSDD